MTEETNNLKKFSDLIKDIFIAMLTTIDRGGNLTSRPMSSIHVEYDGTLWFFTNARSAKVEDIKSEAIVSVTYANPAKHAYVSISGTADIINDKQKIKELWNPIYKAWFPEGLDDPDIRLIRVHVNKADYWDISSSKLVQLIGLAKALVTGKTYAPGIHGHIETGHN